jgi:hypothetical protein
MQRPVVHLNSPDAHVGSVITAQINLIWFIFMLGLNMGLCGEKKMTN